MTLGIAVIGTLIALGGLFFTLLERRDRKRAVTSERKDRDEQVGLLRRQVEAVEAEGPGGRLSSVASVAPSFASGCSGSSPQRSSRSREPSRSAAPQARLGYSGETRSFVRWGSRRVHDDQRDVAAISATSGIVLLRRTILIRVRVEPTAVTGARSQPRR